MRELGPRYLLLYGVSQFRVVLHLNLEYPLFYLLSFLNQILLVLLDVVLDLVREAEQLLHLFHACHELLNDLRTLEAVRLALIQPAMLVIHGTLGVLRIEH